MFTFERRQSIAFLVPKPTMLRGQVYHFQRFPLAFRRPSVAPNACSVSCAAERSSAPPTSTPRRLLVLGATGRVALNTILSLVHISPCPLHLVLASRSESRALSAISRLSANIHSPPSLPSPTVSFVVLDIADEIAVREAASDADVVLHCAGPFQRSRAPTAVLRATLAAGAAYVDVCDDAEHAAACRALFDVAVERGCPAIICAGIYPGVSNIMASRAARLLRTGENLVDSPVFSPRIEQDSPGGEDSNSNSAQDSIDVLRSLKLYYHTAGSGGIGATVLASTFLLLSEQAIAFDKAGTRVEWDAASHVETVDFGGKVGRQEVYALSLPEVESLRELVVGKQGAAEVFAKFGTAPSFWNVLLRIMAKTVPGAWLSDAGLMGRLARLSLPVVRAVDAVVGARTAMMVRAEGEDGRGVCSVFEHEQLARGVGDSTAAFVVELLRDKEGDGIRGGVWFPEELDQTVQERILGASSVSCDRFHTWRF